MITPARPKPGTVYLVGAGPGHPGLLTLRAVECLKKADLVMYDYLANASLVEHARPDAELMRLGHHNGGPRLSPAEIIALMVKEAAAGKCVVRLKGGDPSIFARGGDEATALREAGLPFEIVPGITSGLALAAFAEIPLTHFEDASAVALVTGRERDAKLANDDCHLDYAGLAAFPGTLVFYMAVKGTQSWSSALMAEGKSPDTPVAIVRWCSRAWQQTVRCTLGTVAEVVESTGLRPPALFVVGKVVARTPRLSWFESRPLFGSTVLVAGSASTAGRLRERLAEAGAEVITQPAIRITPPETWVPVDDTLGRIATYDWLVLSTPNAVDSLLDHIDARGGDARWLGGVKIVALGSGTVDRLTAHRLKPDLTPEGYRPAILARTLTQTGAGRVLLARSHGERPILAAELEKAGATVGEIVVYGTAEVLEPDPDVAMSLVEEEIDWVAVTSPATARSLDRLYGSALRTARIASISPLTSAALRELGLEPDVEAAPATVAGLVDAIAAAVPRLAVAETAGVP